MKRGKNSSTYRGRVQLFSRNIKIFDDSAKIASGEKWPVPFEVLFPEGFESRIVGNWEKDARFDCSQEQPLPPSFVNNYSGFSNHYESFIEYRVGVYISVPHLPVEIVRPEKYTEPVVHYQQPRLPRPLEPLYHRHKNRIDISNEFLLPEEDRPSGFRQRFRAGISSDYYPHYNFDWVLVAPQHVYLGQPMAFEVYIRPREDCTAVVIPEIRLTGLGVSLVASTVVRAEKQFISSPEAGHDEEVKYFRGILDDPGPFSKANDWRKIINTAPVPDSIASTFKTVNICHTHCIRVHVNFAGAEKRFSYDPLLKVTVLPLLMDTSVVAAASSSSAVAGLSSQPAGSGQQPDETLPRYDDGLPQYHEAVADRLQPPAKDT